MVRLILREYLANFRSTITAVGLCSSGSVPSSILSKEQQNEFLGELREGLVGYTYLE